MRTPRLIRGAHLALLAPSSPVYEKDKRDAAVLLLKSMGYGVTVYPSVTAACGYLSGSDAVRAKDVMDAFLDDAVHGIVCLRGGYGAARILPLLNFNLIKQHPKVFVGYSDVTALHLALLKHCAFPVFHGPMGAELEGLNPPSLRLWQRALTGKADKFIKNPDGAEFSSFGAQKAVSGPLIGGNMTVLSSLLGTAHMPDWAGKILLLEDVGEKPYRIDGMLTHMHNLGLMKGLKGVVLGDFTDCEPTDASRSMSALDVIKANLPPHLPVLYGLHIGHGKDKITLPLGVSYRLDTRKNTLKRLDG